MSLNKRPKKDKENQAVSVNTSIFLPPPERQNNRRVSFCKTRSKDQNTTTKQKLGQDPLSSCLITSTPDLRLPGGANNPAVRNVGKLPRTDSECQFNAPGYAFLRGHDTTVLTHEVKMSSSIKMKKELKHKCDFFPTYVDPSPFKDQNTQTLYRESSAQTLAYLPQVTDAEKAQTFELFSLPTVLPSGQPPGLYEVEILDRARKRWSFSDALRIHMTKLNNESRKLAMRTKYKAILEAFEWQQWIEREEYIQECQMLRLNIVIKMFDKREREMHAASKSRIENACEGIEKRRKAGLRKNEIEFQRGMRRLEIQLARVPRKWIKQTPMQDLGSPCSEFYGPLMRHGVDPARRSYQSITGRKAFDMRIDDLAKRVNMNNLTCPFRKLKDWSKPKEHVREYEQNFCNEAHLQKLYESLKTLRTLASKEREEPRCLKKRWQALNERTPSQVVLACLTDLYEHDKYTIQPVPRARGEIKKPAGFDSAAPGYMLQHLKAEGKIHEMESMLNVYEGSYIGWVMQFLSEEMTRLTEQRKLHFFTILAQKERWRREAAEGGLRQKESELRMMYEELFQQSNLVNNHIANEHISQILRHDMYNVAENEAAERVKKLAIQIDADIARWLESFKLIQNPLTFEPLRYLLDGMVNPDLDAALQRYENFMIAQYIIDEVIFPKMWITLDPFDIANTLTSDLISRLIDDDLYMFSSSSENEMEGPLTSPRQEANAIIRKLIRQAVPGNRWKTETERIVAENYNDIFDEIFANIINPPPINPKDLTKLRSFKSHNTIPMSDILFESDSSDVGSNYISGRESAFVSLNFLSLLRKFKCDNVTGILKNLDVYKGEELMQGSDTFLKKFRFYPMRKKPTNEELFSMKSSLNITQETNLKSLKGRGLRVVLPSGEERNSLEELNNEPVEDAIVNFISDAITIAGESEKVSASQSQTSPLHFQIYMSDLTPEYLSEAYSMQESSSSTTSSFQDYKRVGSSVLKAFRSFTRDDD